ncbi:MAG TPA: sulfite exporter TauE/SafE family protein, partial [Pleomorphomonadaceae bacterium]|nr:sulfite exporter TauE/SafE family protein [Pleomorphomonadaceae bacterium]
LAGNVARLASVPPSLPLWAAAVVIGAFIGFEIASRRGGGRTLLLRRALSLVLAIAGMKLIFLG